MQSWRWRFLGIDAIPSWLSDSEIEAFFTLSPAELATVRTRHGELHQLGLALHIGFLKMAGCALNSTDVLPRRLLMFLGAQLEIQTLRVSSLRALYPRRPTLHEHQKLAQAVLRVRGLTSHAERQLVAHLQRCATGITQAADLLGPARAWLHDKRYLIVHERQLLDLCRRVIRNDEQALSRRFNREISTHKRQAWLAALTAPHPGIVQEVGTVASLLNLVSVGMGVGFTVIGKDFIYPKNLVVVPLRGVRYATSFVLGWVKGRTDPVQERLIEIVKELAK